MIMIRLDLAICYIVIAVLLSFLYVQNNQVRTMEEQVADLKKQIVSISDFTLNEEGELVLKGPQ